MKLSHRDFRPARRSKYVTRPPKRRPTLRILLLLVLGLGVYLQFDRVAHWPLWRSLHRPGDWLARFRAPAGQPPIPAVDLAWEGDSSAVKAICPGTAESCLGAGFPLGADRAGEIGELLAKAEAQWQARAAEGFAAVFQRASDMAAPEPRLELVSLEMRGPRPLVLRREGMPGAWAFCADGLCLDQLRPQPPLSGFRASRGLLRTDPASPAEPSARFAADGRADVRPILRGRVVSVPGPGDSLGWIKLHHGRNLFSYYRGLARAGAPLRAGAMLETGDTLGWLSDTGSAALDLRVESEGRLLDPLAFLGIQETPEAAHGP